MTKTNSLHNLSRKKELRIKLAKTSPGIPSQRMAFNRYAPKSNRCTPKVLLLGDCVAAFVLVGKIRRRNEFAPCRARDGGTHRRAEQRIIQHRIRRFAQGGLSLASRASRRQCGVFGDC